MIACRVHIGILLSVLLGLTPAIAPADDRPETLPNTAKLTLDRPLDEAMVEGIDRFALRELAGSVAARSAKWQRDTSSPEAYEKSIAGNRERLRTIIGAVDPRVPTDDFELISTTSRNSVILAKSGKFEMHAIRWQVLKGVTAEGLLLQPTTKPKARIIVLSDADESPENFLGFGDANRPYSPYPLVLAERGVQVVVPTLISRDNKYSGTPGVGMTNQPHREFVYRMGFEMGRHIIGYEVQKVLAAIDILAALNKSERANVPIGVAGWGEGGLIALYAAALDPRIQSTRISGYFNEREALWREPIYRNVWSLLTEFGDAEAATLVAPRALTIDCGSVPEISGPKPPVSGQAGGAAPGEIKNPDPASVKREFARFEALIPQALRAKAALVADPTDFKSARASFEKGLDLEPQSEEEHRTTVKELTVLIGTLPRPNVDARQHRQLDELVAFTQALMEKSAKVRTAEWDKLDHSSPEAWRAAADKQREHVWKTLFGKLPDPTIPPNVRTRKILSESQHTGYEVTIDVYPDVFAGGILLLPTDLKPGEKRPVVVCQHGLEGVSMDTITTQGQAYNYYKGFTAELAKRGFITYAPQNPYRGADKFRTLQRKSNPLGRSLFSYIIPQHQRTLAWLATLPHIDAKRIGFYGLSYGGKTAVRVPTMLPEYALSICSADYNEWVRKNVSNADRFSYIFTGEYEMFEWNMGHVANYAELASLMAPRPFMVERGHDDGVAPDEWVAWEYAKVRRHYDKLGLGDRTEIEFFNGPHTINGVGTYAFLHKHLNWPVRK